MQRRNHLLTTGTAIGALLAAAIALVGCGGNSASTAQNPAGGPSLMGGATPIAVAQAQKADSPVDPAIVAADNSFGVSLLDALLPGSDGGNIAISPLSVALATTARSLMVLTSHVCSESGSDLAGCPVWVVLAFRKLTAGR